MRALGLTTIALLLAFLLPRPADGAMPQPGVANPEQAKAALAAFQRAWQPRNAEAGAEALRALSRVKHPKVADQLLRVADSDVTPAFRKLALDLVRTQKHQEAHVGPTLQKFVGKQLKQHRKMLAKGMYGDLGIPIDPVTGEVETETPEAIARLAKKRSIEAVREAAIRSLTWTGYRRGLKGATLAPFLESGHDGLVLATIEYFEAWRDYGSLEALGALFHLYPDDHKWNTGGEVVVVAANSDAKGEWLARFGDPGIPKPRPEIVKALRKAISKITGETVKKPRELTDLLRRKDVKRRAKSGYWER